MRSILDKTYDGRHSFRMSINGHEFRDLVETFFIAHDILMAPPSSIFYDLMLSHFLECVKLFEGLGNNDKYDRFKSINSYCDETLTEFYTAILDDIFTIFQSTCLQFNINFSVANCEADLLLIKDFFSSEGSTDCEFVDLLILSDDSKKVSKCSFKKFIRWWSEYILFIFEVVFGKLAVVPDHIKKICGKHSVIDDLFLRL